MIVKNPTKNDIEVQIEGVKYFVRAESELTGVPTAHAEYWKNNLHNFLKISKESSVKKADEEKEEVQEVEITPEPEEIIEEDSTEDETLSEESEEESDESEDEEVVEE